MKEIIAIEIGHWEKNNGVKWRCDRCRGLSTACEVCEDFNEDKLNIEVGRELVRYLKNYGYSIMLNGDEADLNAGKGGVGKKTSKFYEDLENFNQSADCRFGKVISAPSLLMNLISFTNGNTSISDSLTAVSIDVLDLISGTCIKPNEICGFEIWTHGNREDRQVFVDVNGVSSPMFHAGSKENPEHIWATMHGAPDDTPATFLTETHIIKYMNRYNGTHATNDVVPLRPFFSSALLSKFNVQIRPNNNRKATVTVFKLLDKDGNSLGTAMYENNTWSRLRSHVKNCGCERLVAGVAVHFTTAGGIGFETYTQLNSLRSESEKLSWSIADSMDKNKGLGNPTVMRNPPVKNTVDFKIPNGDKITKNIEKVPAPFSYCEFGFLDNEENRKCFDTPAKRINFGRAAARGILKYLGVEPDLKGGDGSEVNPTEKRDCVYAFDHFPTPREYDSVPNRSLIVVYNSEADQKHGGLYRIGNGNMYYKNVQ